MNDHPDVADAATTEGLPVAPSLGPALEAMRVPRRVIGFLTRSDLLAAHHPRLSAARHTERGLARGAEVTA